MFVKAERSGNAFSTLITHDLNQSFTISRDTNSKDPKDSRLKDIDGNLLIRLCGRKYIVPDFFNGEWRHLVVGNKNLYL